MYPWIAGNWRTAGFVAASTALIYLSAVFGVRLGERRTLAEMSAFDFIAAVALGAMVGRTATTTAPSYVQGLTGVVALLLSHRFLSWGRLRWGWFRFAVERPPLVLMIRGQVVRGNLHRAHVDESDLYTVLRQHDIHGLDEVELLVLEARGVFSVVRVDERRPLDELLTPLTAGQLNK